MFRNPRAVAALPGQAPDRAPLAFHRQLPGYAPTPLIDAPGLPPAYLEVGQLDIFRDEDTAYATKLSLAGVPVEFHLHAGVPHEFDFVAFESDIARRVMADRIRVLRSA